MSTLDRFRLDGRTALVTGASRNIGAAISRAFAEAGAALVLNARTPEPLEALAAELRERHGVQAVAIAADLSDATARARLIAEVGRLGGADVLVNNATGGGRPDSALQTTPEQWRAAMEVNVTAPFELCQALIPGMRQRGRGAIVNLLSTAAFAVVPPMLAYGAMKSALWTLTRYLARECAPEVRVNAICPGTVQEGGELKVASWSKLIPLTALGRVGDSHELAATALYLASDASSYTTGQCVFVDGGRVMLP
ncbi:MAG: SDR family oxidoreductase [Deltaproteobacteria bacterium]|nr:SDR family oxidoreductase [Deltaproteobacteria bacterium]